MRVHEMSNKELWNEYEQLIKELHYEPILESGVDRPRMERMIAEILYRLLINEFDVE